MRLHLAAPDHSAHNLIIYPVFGAAGISTKIIADNLADLLVEGRVIFIARDGNGCRYLTWFWLAKIDDKIAFGYFFGLALIICFLPSVNV